MTQLSFNKNFARLALLIPVFAWFYCSFLIAYGIGTLCGITFHFSFGYGVVAAGVAALVFCVAMNLPASTFHRLYHEKLAAKKSANCRAAHETLKTFTYKRTFYDKLLLNFKNRETGEVIDRNFITKPFSILENIGHFLFELICLASALTLLLVYFPSLSWL